MPNDISDDKKMIPEILVTLFGNSAYDVIKSITKHALGKSDNELELRVQIAIVNSVNIFFKKFGNDYGKESNSFLAREENWITVANYLRHDTPDLTIEQINPAGFNNSPKADGKALKYLISTIKNEFKNDLFLNLLLGVKESVKAKKEIDSKLQNAISKIEAGLDIKENNNKTKSFNVTAVGGDLPPQNDLKDGKLYVRNITDKVKLTYMKRGNKIYSEAFMDDGAVMYYEIDENAKVKIIQPPYPVSVHVPPQYIIRKEVVNDKSGKKRLIIHGKWGLKLVYEIISNDTFRPLSIDNAVITISSKDKRMIVKPSGVN